MLNLNVRSIGEERGMKMANLLIVDDQPCVRRLLSEKLAEEGHRVSGIGDAQLVIARIAAFVPDLVLLDPYLEGSDGWAVLQNIKRLDPDLPVIILTACRTFKDDPRAFLADSYVIKSFDFRELIERVTHILECRPSSELTDNLKTGFPEFSTA
jgi:DNA-binding response OmpR family regulator